jgi:hypothetical protein
VIIVFAQNAHPPPCYCLSRVEEVKAVPLPYPSAFGRTFPLCISVSMRAVGTEALSIGAGKQV